MRSPASRRLATHRKSQTRNWLSSPMKLTSRNQKPPSRFLVILVAILALMTYAQAQEPKNSPSQADPAKKANARPVVATVDKPEPFDGASVEKMRDQCVTLE